MNKKLKIVVIFIAVVAVIFGGLVVWRYLKTQRARKVDLATFDFSRCFRGNPERNYHLFSGRPDFTDRLEYTLKDDKGNYLQDLLIFRHRNAKMEVLSELGDSRCQFVDCKIVILLKSFIGVRVKTKWDFREEQGKTPYKTEYHVAIGNLLISSTGNGYSWEESERNSRSAVECILGELY